MRLYVEKKLAAADDFTRPFQEAMTAWCWGFGWGDDVIDAKTRSMMNLSMIGALGKMSEWETHCRGALGNGLTQDQLRAIIHVIGIYRGVPQSNSSAMGLSATTTRNNPFFDSSTSCINRIF